MWDIFDDALMETRDFDSFFDRIFDKLLEQYKEQGFSFEQQELVNAGDSSKDDDSYDSAQADLIGEINNISTTQMNLFEVRKKTSTDAE